MSFSTPAQWGKRKKPVDVLRRREEIARRVIAGDKRKIYKIEAAKGFAGDESQSAACLYVSGCSFFCQYCFVSPASLSGVKGNFYTPEEAFQALKKIIVRTKNPQVQMNGGEVFLAPEWTVELIRLLSEFFERDCRFTSEKRPGRIWCDTMGFDLLCASSIFPKLIPYQKHVALFLSTKGHPDDYEILARAPQEFADDAFCALALAWGHELVAVPEVLDRMFYPERMDWYIERLRRVHPNAPRVLHFDKYSPVDYVAWAPGKKMRAIGFRSNKSDPCRNAPSREEAIEEWQLRLKALYGEEGMKPPYRGIDTPVFDCDRYPDESFRLVEELILNSSS